MANAKFYIIDGVKIEVETPALCADLRFFPQNQLIAMGTNAAKAELDRRAAIVQKKYMVSGVWRTGIPRRMRRAG